MARIVSVFDLCFMVDHTFGGREDRLTELSISYYRNGISLPFR
jgi:hypothetical protein